MSFQKAILIIMDGLGEAPAGPGNAVTLAQTPFLDKCRQTYSSTLLEASGQAVGLPAGVMGASEPGHLTMGAGRVVWQPLEEINQAIANGSFFQKTVLLKLFRENQKLHLLGMLSNAGVHAHIQHLFALLEMAKQNNCSEVYLHIITDGRDVPERSVREFLTALQRKIEELQIGQIVSVIGRYYAMDRDQNWERTQVAYDLLTQGKGEKVADFQMALENAYQKVETDYYLPPYLFPSFQPIEPHDNILFFNFRSDRAKQLTAAFVDTAFTHFSRKKVYDKFVAMGPYTQNAPVVFPPQKIKNNLGNWLAQKQIPQLRIAETEKYAHVTFFFNSQEEEPYVGEERILIHSPKCPSYAEKPEMSALQLTETVCQKLETQKYGAVILNFANPDLVGHSGDLKATIQAVETVDKCIAKVTKTALENDYQILLTADHGNAEQMFYADGKTACPAHTTNPVRCYLIDKTDKNIKLKIGLGLSSIAPTLLKIMALDQPHEMTGEALF